MESTITNALGNNVQDLHGILCHVIPNCENLSKYINVFLEKYPDGCVTASSCTQTIIDTKKYKIENVGVMFVTDDSIIFIGSRQSSTNSPSYETVHKFNDITNVVTSRKSIIVTLQSQMFTYKFKDQNNIIDLIIQTYKVNPSWICIKNNFYNPSHMKIVMLTIGSRGDVQPFICLAKGLIERGYNVKIVTHNCFANFVRSHEIEFGGLTCDPKELMKLCVNNSMFSINFVNEGKKIFLDRLNILLNEAYNECKCANVLISTPTSIAGYHIAEKLQIPFFNAFTMPMIDHDGQNILTLSSSDYYKSWYTTYKNYFVDLLTDKAMWFVYSNIINNWRVTILDLPPKKYFESNKFIFDKQQTPTLYCYSQHIFSKPDDWKDNIYVTGYWKSNIDESFVPSNELETFLNNHRDPLFVSFGSIPINNSDVFYNIFISYCDERKIPLIIGKGWATTNIKSSSNMIVIDEVPYDYLLNYVKVMVHHGGAGTVSACVHSAIPMLIIPFFGDQFFWGKCVQDLKIGCAISYTEATKFNISEMLDLLLGYKTHEIVVYNEIITDDLETNFLYGLYANEENIENINEEPLEDTHEETLNPANEELTQNTKVEFAENIKKLSEKINKENGIQNAIDIIENLMQTSYVVPTGLPDDRFLSCANPQCQRQFTIINRKHHCRNCTKCFCNKCSRHQIGIKKYRIQLERVCENCFKDLSDSII